MPKKIIIGSICYRDLVKFDEIKRFSKINYGIKFVNLLKNGSSFSVKYFKKKLKKYQISFLIVKLHSEKTNQKIYDALNTYAPYIPRLNSLKSVNTCESRKETFKLVNQKNKKLIIPKCYYSINAAYEAVSNGTPLIIKLDTHNIRNFSKYDRIVGVARSTDDFLKIIREYDVENNSLFFQKYLGKHDLVYKVYVIDRYVQTITSQNLLLQHKLSPLELIHHRVPIEKELKRQIIRLGRKFGMAIFGVDYVLKDGIPYIVDINDFPSFRNIPEAISLISDYIYKFCLARQTLGKIPMSLKVKTYMA
jgi:glutathione synthase/RimK-type ligase-like ATP-grasp enzyme